MCLRSATLADAGLYVCRLTPPALTGLSALLSNGSNLTVVPGPAVLGSDPAGRVDTFEGRNLTLRVSVSAVPPFVLEWRRGGVLVGRGTELAIGQLTVGDAGSYSVTLTQDGISVTRELVQVWAAVQRASAGRSMANGRVPLAQVYVTALTITSVALSWLGSAAPLTATAVPPGYAVTVANNVSSLQAAAVLSDPLGRAALLVNGSRIELRSGVASASVALPLGVSVWELSTPIGAQQTLSLRITRLPLKEVAGGSLCGAPMCASRLTWRRAADRSNITVRLDMPFPATEAGVVRRSCKRTDATGRARVPLTHAAAAAGRCSQCVHPGCRNRCACVRACVSRAWAVRRPALPHTHGLPCQRCRSTRAACLSRASRRAPSSSPSCSHRRCCSATTRPLSMSRRGAASP
jgi:hypothetical protein